MVKEDIETLIRELNCDDVIRCQKARRTLVEMGHEAIPILVEALGNKQHWVRWEAAKALGQISSKDAIQALVDALEDNEFDVRWLAAEALIKNGRYSLEPLLVALADHGNKSLSLRNGAHHVLHDMDRGDLDKILRPVMNSLEDTAPYSEVLLIAEEALDALRKL